MSKDMNDYLEIILGIRRLRKYERL